LPTTLFGECFTSFTRPRPLRFQFRASIFVRRFFIYFLLKRRPQFPARHSAIVSYDSQIRLLTTNVVRHIIVNTNRSRRTYDDLQILSTGVRVAVRRTERAFIWERTYGESRNKIVEGRRARILIFYSSRAGFKSSIRFPISLFDNSNDDGSPIRFDRGFGFSVYCRFGFRHEIPSTDDEPKRYTGFYVATFEIRPARSRP